MLAPLLKTYQLSHQYPAEGVLTFPDLNLDRGQAYLLLGNSGSGKTTFLHLVGGLLPIQSGEVWFEDAPLSTRSPAALHQFRKQKIGFIFQKPYLLPALTLWENIALAQKLALAEVQQEAISTLLAQLEIEALHKKYPQELSGGQLQRAAIAQALVRRPSLLLADEPTSNLDPKRALQVAQLLAQTCQLFQTTLLIATHDQRLQDKFEQQFFLGE
ncbi:ABC transporter ATP-binding protein [Hugenholtzia roseola]|uniref:ABC transporter ATP-binding protein n=1 Tax=Hugenholtzia roseola TaxID=1002 RepID=UPI0003F8BD23|nr:ATP-binding cassette domain-containing protein [Hugenholtzia roseola]